MDNLSREEKLLLEEYKSLRAEIQENLRTRSSILLYLVIITASVVAPAVTSGNFSLLSFLMPLMFPLLIWWNSLYIANLAISHYIQRIIIPKLEPLQWERIASRQRKVRLSMLIKIHTAPGLAIIYVIMGLAPSVYFAIKEPSLEFYLLLALNVFLSIIVIYSTFRSPRLVQPAIEEINKLAVADGTKEVKR